MKSLLNFVRVQFFLTAVLSAPSARADPIYFAEGDVSGEGGSIFFDSKMAGFAVKVDGGGSLEGTSAAVLGDARWFSIEAAAGVAGAGDDLSPGLSADGYASFFNTRFFFNQQNEPILFGTVQVTAQYAVEADSLGSAGDGSARVEFSIASLQTQFAEVLSAGSESGQLMAEYTGDLSSGLGIQLEAFAAAQGGTFLPSNPSLGAGNAQIRVTSIKVNGFETIPEPSSLIILALVALSTCRIRRRTAREDRRIYTAKRHECQANR